MNLSSLNPISDHVYWLAPDATTDRPVLGAVDGQKATLLIDAGNSPAHAKLLLDEVAKLSQAQQHYLVLTHWHWDQGCLDGKNSSCAANRSACGQPGNKGAVICDGRRKSSIFRTHCLHEG